LDAKEVILKKMKDVEFPEAFLKRWVLSTNDKLTPETLDKEFPIMLDDLKWYLVKNKLSKQYECKIEKDDINAYAKKIAKMQFAQYGMNNVPDDILENYAQESLKKEDAVKNMIERIIEEKVLDKVKESIKLETKEISYQDFNKMFEEK
jgi:trigger factor